MARASTAASAQAGAWQTFAFFRVIPALRRPDFEPLVRWAVPVSLAVFLTVLIGASCAFVFNEQGRIVAAAMADVDLVASVIVGDIDAQSKNVPNPAHTLAHAIPLRALTSGQRVILADKDGKVIASYPDLHLAGTMADHLGDRQLLTVFAEKAGVMRLTLPSGNEALATVRALHEPLGQIAIIHPMTDVLSGWRDGLFRIVVVLFCTGGVLTTLAAAYFRQATRARRADSSCQRMRDRVDMVLSRGHCGLWDWDLARGHIDWSLSMYQILGMVPCGKALSTGAIDDLIHPADGTLEDALRRLSTETAIDHVFRMRHASGTWVWLRARVELVGGEANDAHLVGIAIDITDTMAREERTAKADMRLRDAIETISEAFVIWDAENQLVMCNSKFQRFYDLPPEAIIQGTPYATVMACGTPPVVQAEVPLRTPQPMGARTFEAQLGDGRWLQIDERRTKDGGYVSVGTDITALKRNEEQLMESERRLRHSVIDLRTSRQDMESQAQVLAEIAEKYLEQKAEAEQANRAKSDFLANMSHELRTPLNAILGFSEIMMMEAYGALGSPLYQEYCKDIHSSGRYLLNVIADVLEMSRLEAGRVRLEKQEFQLAATINAAIASVAPLAQDNTIKIVTDVAPDALLVADRTAMEKVFTILLNNSVKYTPVGGQVIVRVRSVQGSLNIYVEDTGVGITPEAIARLGHPFEQSDKTLKDGMRGSGLGLAIARSLVDLHGGSMRIKSKPGFGTLVLVHLPNKQMVRPHLVAASAPPPMQPVRALPQRPMRTLRKMSLTA